MTADMMLAIVAVIVAAVALYLNGDKIEDWAKRTRR